MSSHVASLPSSSASTSRGRITITRHWLPLAAFLLAALFLGDAARTWAASKTFEPRAGVPSAVDTEGTADEIVEAYHGFPLHELDAHEDAELLQPEALQPWDEVALRARRLCTELGVEGRARFLRDHIGPPRARGQIGIIDDSSFDHPGYNQTGRPLDAELEERCRAVYASFAHDLEPMGIFAADMIEDAMARDFDAGRFYADPLLALDHQRRSWTTDEKGLYRRLGRGTTGGWHVTAVFSSSDHHELQEHLRALTILRAERDHEIRALIAASHATDRTQDR